jgi:hypothetical protein
MYYPIPGRGERRRGLDGGTMAIWGIVLLAVEIV